MDNLAVNTAGEISLTIDLKNLKMDASAEDHAKSLVAKFAKLGVDQQQAISQISILCDTQLKLKISNAGDIIVNARRLQKANPPTTLTLIDLSSELHNQMFSYLDPVSSTVLGLTNKKLYAIHKSLHLSVKLDQVVQFHSPSSFIGTATLGFLLEEWGAPNWTYRWSPWLHNFLRVEDLSIQSRRQMEEFRTQPWYCLEGEVKAWGYGLWTR